MSAQRREPPRIASAIEEPSTRQTLLRKSLGSRFEASLGTNFAASWSRTRVGVRYSRRSPLATCAPFTLVVVPSRNGGASDDKAVNRSTFRKRNEVGIRSPWRRIYATWAVIAVMGDPLLVIPRTGICWAVGKIPRIDRITDEKILAFSVQPRRLKAAAIFRRGVDTLSVSFYERS